MLKAKKRRIKLKTWPILKTFLVELRFTGRNLAPSSVL